MTLETLQNELNSFKSDVNVFWLLFGSVLVFFMECGFTFIEVGCVQKKNVKSILIVNILDTAISILTWWLIGYGVAYGGLNYGAFDSNPFIGTDDFALTGSFRNKALHPASGFSWAWFIFQWVFAATASTIVNGAVAERIKFGAYLIYSIVLNALIYPVIVHLAWSQNGWASAFNPHESRLLQCGIVDFAGSCVVHMTGGMAALISLILLGPRHGRFLNNQVQTIPQFSHVYQTVGTQFLIFGWFGFNGVSTALITGKSLIAARAIVNSMISGGSACLSSLVLTRHMKGFLSLTAVNNGILAGLVGITSGCATVDPEGALIIGCVAGCVYVSGSALLLNLKIDDVVDAVALHLGCGLWGFFATGLFTTQNMYELAYYADRGRKCCGAFYGGEGNLIGAHVIFILVHIGFTGTICTCLFLFCKHTIGLRISIEDEIDGCDTSRHGGLINY